MEPQQIGVSPTPVGDQGSAPKVETGRQSQSFLEAAPFYEKKPEFHMMPTWGEKISDGLKKTGLIASCIICGALAVALFPFPIVGGFLYSRGHSYLNVAMIRPLTEEEEKKGQRLEMAGIVLAAPVAGMVACVREFRKPSWSALTKFADEKITELAHKTPTFNPQELKNEEADILEDFKTQFKENSKKELLKLQKYIKYRWNNPFDPDQSTEKVKKFHAIFEKYLQSRP